MTEAAPSPISIPIFRRMWIATVISNFGALIQTVGAAWMMTTISGSPQMVALVQASTSLPIMLLSLWAGAMADNHDRRKLMLWAQCYVLCTSACLSLFTYLGLVTPWTLLAFTFLIGCGAAVNAPAWQASVGDMTPREMLPSAVVLNGMGINIARTVGPAIGGAIVAAVGAAGAFAANVVSCFGLIFVLARWRPSYPERTLPREQIGVAMMAGLQYVLLSPPLRLILLRSAGFGFAAIALPAMMPLMARDMIGGGPLTYGLLLGSFGLGAIVAALKSRPLRERFSGERIVVGTALCVAVGGAGAASSGSLLLAAPALALAGAGWMLAFATFNSTVQLSSPRWVVARSLALYQMAVYGAMTLGSWCFGMLSHRFGVPSALYIASALHLVVALSGRRIPIADTGALRLDPADTWRQPNPSLPIEARSGPIVITIEYRVAAENATLFLAAMSERRRIRRRDGARNWRLCRDLHDPEMWLEQYQVATWTEYVRHNSRRTLDDNANADILLRLRIDKGEPVVHRMIERQVGSLRSSGAADPLALGDA